MEKVKRKRLAKLDANKLRSYFSRCGQETPPFFRKLRLIGLAVAAAGTAVLAAPVALPALVTAIGGYLIVGGAVATAVSQATIEGAEDCTNDPEASAGSEN